MRWQSTLVLLALVGCSRIEFNQGKLRARLDGPAQVNDETIRQRLEAKPQLTPGFRMAIHISNPDKRWGGHAWSAKDRERILQLAQASCGPRFCKEVVEISAIEGDGDKLFLRQAAAERNAQAVLWIRGIQDVQTMANGRAWTNLLIIPAFFIESEDVQSVFLASAQLIDVGNGFLYSDIQTVGKAKSKQTPTHHESKEIVARARAQALDQLLPALDRGFQSLALPEKKQK